MVGKLEMVKRSFINNVLKFMKKIKRENKTNLMGEDITVKTLRKKKSDGEKKRGLSRMKWMKSKSNVTDFKIRKIIWPSIGISRIC